MKPSSIHNWVVRPEFVQQKRGGREGVGRAEERETGERETRRMRRRGGWREGGERDGERLSLIHI